MGIWIDKNYDAFRRDVYSFNLVMRDVGGLYTAIFSMGLFLTWIFRDTLFFTTIIGKLYNVETTTKSSKKRRLEDIENEAGGDISSI